MLSYNENDITGKLIHNLWAIHHVMCSISGGRAGQKRILTILLRNGTVTQAELTEHLGIHPGSASEVLSKLENSGLIHREENRADRRTIDICLTEKGKAEAEIALAQREQTKKEMFSVLSEKEQAELLALLEKLIADWNTRYARQAERGRK
ncbi:MarR family transcriptional regulator [Pseudoclostridium thermosuccinogenes]|uniref:MarR family winged helix-turn-helix transcriptional regulator n=1 Tax=Clostridium thermosuccinogenes TaxID=84032 RepID=UPI000CCBF24E|nr:MarR family transcriptional regulator [Pseudoclostridium thermosuccinogenes]PNT93817.1 hypothetical protein CDQ83_10105 [Pseudoclostridium thermosuccinogenes]